MQTASNVERLSGFATPPSESAVYFYADRFVLNAILSELPGIAIAAVTVLYLASMFLSLL